MFKPYPKHPKYKTINTLSFLQRFYKHSAWKYLSRCVLLYHSKKSQDGTHVVNCSTCNRLMPLKSRESQAGHLVKVTDSLRTAIIFENIAPQCDRCNRYHGGKQLDMAFFLDKTFPNYIGEYDLKKEPNEKTSEYLFRLSKFITVYKPDLDLIKGEFKKKFDKLVLEKGNPWGVKKVKKD
jgi:hypothetical protein